MDSQPSIAVIDENPLRAAIIEDGLREAGYRNITRIEAAARLMQRLVEISPDVIIIDIECPSRDVLEQMLHVSRAVQKPVAMFVDQSDSAMIAAAIDAGVSAYVVDGLRKERVKSILDMAISRFNAFAKLKAELEEAKSQIEDRKLIDRAKGILMKARQIPESEAYALLRKAAMNENRRIAEIARSIITASELLG